MGEQDPVADLEHVTFSYGNGAAPPVLSDVTLRIEARDFVGVIGPNGGGKTTLLQILLGLIMPQQGSVRVFGQPPAAVRHRVGYVPQHASIDPAVPATALDIVLMGRLRLSSWGPRFGTAHKDAAMEALALTGTRDLSRRAIAELSGGQRQRVLIARALAAEAELLLLDEPTQGVDLHREREVLDLLARLNETMPIVMVSHDVHMVSAHLKGAICVNRTVERYAASEVSPEVIEHMYHGHEAAHSH
ncbi:MAG: ABC transporter ATP-binding protein [bacterium]|nr:ABC transporter ATP-binding protein [bacterium]